MITKNFNALFSCLLLLTSFTCFAAERDISVNFTINGIECTIQESILKKMPTVNALYQVNKSSEDQDGKFSLSFNIKKDHFIYLIELLKTNNSEECTKKINTLFENSISPLSRIYELRTFINQLNTLKIDFMIINLLIKQIVNLIITTASYQDGLEICTQSFEQQDLNRLFKEFIAQHYKHTPIIIDQVISYESQIINVQDDQMAQENFGQVVRVNTHRTATTLEPNVAPTIAQSCSAIEIYKAVYRQNHSEIRFSVVTDVAFREMQISIYPHIQVTKQANNSLVARYHDQAPTGLVDSVLLTCGF